MEKFNTLTCSASTEVLNADNNHNQIILVLWQLHHIASMVIVSPNLVEGRIRECSEKEAKVIATLKRMKKTEPHKLANRAAEWEELDGLVYYRGKLYVLNNIEICQEILKQCHNSVTTGHSSRNLTLELVEHHY